MRKISAGVPAVVDLAAMRDAMRLIGSNPEKINLSPVDLVISTIRIMADYAGGKDAAAKNVALEFSRTKNGEEFALGGMSIACALCQREPAFAIRSTRNFCRKPFGYATC